MIAGLVVVGLVAVVVLVRVVVAIRQNAAASHLSEGWHSERIRNRRPDDDAA